MEALRPERARITTPLGETATLRVISPGEAFGELALLSEGSRRSATVAALEEAETHAVARSDFLRLLHQHPAAYAVLARLLAERVRRLSDRLVHALYEHLQHAERAPVGADERHRHQRLRHVAGALGGLAAEAGVTADLVEDDRLAAHQHRPGDARPGGEAAADELSLPRPGDRLEHELLALKRDEFLAAVTAYPPSAERRGRRRRRRGAARGQHARDRSALSG